MASFLKKSSTLSLIITLGLIGTMNATHAKKSEGMAHIQINNINVPQSKSKEPPYMPSAIIAKNKKRLSSWTLNLPKPGKERRSDVLAGEYQLSVTAYLAKDKKEIKLSDKCHELGKPGNLFNLAEGQTLQLSLRYNNDDNKIACDVVSLAK